MNSDPQYEERNSEALESQAAEERQRLHRSVTELRSRVLERVDFAQRLRERIAPASGAAALLGLMLGYGIAGIFIRR